MADHGGRHGDVRNQHRVVLHPLRARLPHRHGIGRRGGLKSDGEKHHTLGGIRARQLQAIERRVDHPHVAALRLDLEQVARGTGNAQHVAEGAEDDVRPPSQRVGAVDQFERGDAHRAARPVRQLDFRRQQLVQAVLDDGVRLARRRPPSPPMDGSPARAIGGAGFGRAPGYGTRLHTSFQIGNLT